MATVWSPGMLLGVSSAYWRGCTLQAAVRLQIFTGLVEGPLTAAELAGRLSCHERSTALLLDALAALGLLKKRGTSTVTAMRPRSCW